MRFSLSLSWRSSLIAIAQSCGRKSCWPLYLYVPVYVHSCSLNPYRVTISYSPYPFQAHLTMSVFYRKHAFVGYDAERIHNAGDIICTHSNRTCLKGSLFSTCSFSIVTSSLSTRKNWPVIVICRYRGKWPEVDGTFDMSRSQFFHCALLSNGPRSEGPHQHQIALSVVWSTIASVPNPGLMSKLG